MTHPSSITLFSDALEITVLRKGAALVGVRFRGDPRNLVLGFADPADHARVPAYAGGVVGPVANRLRGGRIEIEGTSYQMPLNENGRTTLHSGPEGLHTRNWEVAAQSDTHVELTCTLPDGDCGLPGHRTFTVNYTLTGADLRLTMMGRTDRTTPVNLAAHPYWNLDGAPDLGGHTLQVNANTYLPVNAENLPTGRVAPVKESPFDFTTPQPVPLIPELDVNYCLSTTDSAVLRPAAILSGSDGTSLHIATTAPGLQVYNGAYLPDLPGALTEARDLRPYGAIALEPQHWPDAPHQPAFPNILLHPGEIYRQITTYTLSTGKNRQ